MRGLGSQLGCLAAPLLLVGCASQPRAAVPGAVGPADCAPDNNGAAASQVIRDMYSALTVDDASAVTRLFTRDFYSFDGGVRYSGPELFAMVKQAHVAGTTFVWEVVGPAPHIACNVAWVSWENRGSIESATDRRAITWLESAVLRWERGAWRIAFFHSTRVPPPKV